MHTAMEVGWVEPRTWGWPKKSKSKKRESLPSPSSSPEAHSRGIQEELGCPPASRVPKKTLLYSITAAAGPSVWVLLALPI